MTLCFKKKYLLTFSSISSFQGDVDSGIENMEVDDTDKRENSTSEKVN